MKYFLLLFIISTLLFSENLEETSDLVEIKDNLELTEGESRKIAKNLDIEEKKNISLKDIYEMMDENGNVNIEQLKVMWADLTPKTDGFDWIKTKKGEWFKGQIKAMYDEKIEFNSEEMGNHTFDLEDVSYIKTHNTLAVNIEEAESVTGVICLDNKKLRVKQGDVEYEFEREQVVSFAPNGELERNLWSGKASVSIDKRAGNKKQFDYTAQLNLKRRTDSTRLSIDYLGRISFIESQNTADDHRITEAYDIYITKKFFWTPLFSEYYTDKYQNIDKQLTASVGLGYKIKDTRQLEWSVSGGPGILYTKHYTVQEGTDESVKSASLEMRTSLAYELLKKSSLIYDYKFTLTDKASGTYKHHMIFTLENEITSWLDIDLSFIWDHIKNPTNSEDNNTPFKNDYQVLMGLGVEF